MSFRGDKDDEWRPFGTECPELNSDGSYKTPSHAPHEEDVEDHDSMWTVVATVVASIAVIVSVLLFM